MSTWFHIDFGSRSFIEYMYTIMSVGILNRQVSSWVNFSPFLLFFRGTCPNAWRVNDFWVSSFQTSFEFQVEILKIVSYFHWNRCLNLRLWCHSLFRGVRSTTSSLETLRLSYKWGFSWSTQWGFYPITLYCKYFYRKKCEIEALVKLTTATQLFHQDPCDKLFYQNTVIIC